MSFLNSVLSGIGKTGERPAPLLPPVQNKRRAEEDLARPNGKSAKTSATSTPSPAPEARKQNNAGTKNSSSKASNLASMPYRGTSKPGVPSTPATLSEATIKQPKKGSYKEIMARAKAAATEEKKVAGTISHKPKDKAELTFKKARRLKKRELRDRKLGRVNDNSRPSSSEGCRNVGVAQGNNSEGKKVPKQPSYSGTIKAKEVPKPTYKGTMGARNDSSARIQKPKPRRNVNEYAGTDDEIDSEDEDEGEGYGYSDEESDDMEAGFSDVEQEETSALRMARKEDDEELKLEARLKKEKEEKKKRLEALAKKAKTRY